MQTAANAMLFLYAGKSTPCHFQSCQISWAVVPCSSRTTDFSTKLQYASCLSSGTSASFSSKNFSFRITFSFLCSFSAISAVALNNSFTNSLPSFFYTVFRCRDPVPLTQRHADSSACTNKPMQPASPRQKNKSPGALQCQDLLLTRDTQQNNEINYSTLSKKSKRENVKKRSQKNSPLRTVFSGFPVGPQGRHPRGA